MVSRPSGQMQLPPAPTPPSSSSPCCSTWTWASWAPPDPGGTCPTLGWIARSQSGAEVGDDGGTQRGNFAENKILSIQSLLESLKLENSISPVGESRNIYRMYAVLPVVIADILYAPNTEQCTLG